MVPASTAVRRECSMGSRRVARLARGLGAFFRWWANRESEVAGKTGDGAVLGCRECGGRLKGVGWCAVVRLDGQSND